MVVGLNAHMKMPIGYFLINGWTAEAQTEKVKEALGRLHSVGVKVSALTCDGLPANISTFNQLGANIVPEQERAKPYFLHPVDRSRVFCIMDACHMLKLVRNTWGKQGRIYTADNQVKLQLTTKGTEWRKKCIQLMTPKDLKYSHEYIKSIMTPIQNKWSYLLPYQELVKKP